MSLDQVAAVGALWLRSLQSLQGPVHSLTPEGRVCSHWTSDSTHFGFSFYDQESEFQGAAFLLRSPPCPPGKKITFPAPHQKAGAEPLERGRSELTRGFRRLSSWEAKGECGVGVGMAL